jgi:hypothetical protein
MSYQQQPQQGLPDRNTLMQFFQKYLVLLCFLFVYKCL